MITTAAYRGGVMILLGAQLHQRSLLGRRGCESLLLMMIMMMMMMTTTAVAAAAAAATPVDQITDPRGSYTELHGTLPRIA